LLSFGDRQSPRPARQSVGLPFCGTLHVGAVNQDKLLGHWCRNSGTVIFGGGNGAAGRTRSCFGPHPGKVSVSAAASISKARVVVAVGFIGLSPIAGFRGLQSALGDKGGFGLRLPVCGTVCLPQRLFGVVGVAVVVGGESKAKERQRARNPKAPLPAGQ